MSHLTELQRWLLRQLVRPERSSSDPETVAAANRHLASSGALAPVEQLEIYRRQYWLRHTAALLEDFPALSRLLGQRAWEQLVESYLGVLSRSWTLRDLGAGLPDHIRQQTNLPRQELCLDMARLEWAYVEVFDAAPASSLDVTPLQRLNPEAWTRAELWLAPALRLLRLTYPVAELRAQLRAERSLRHEPGSEAADDAGAGVGSALEPEPHDLVVFRDRHLRLSHRRLDALEAALMRQLQRDPRLLPACERIVERAPNAEQRLEQQLAPWLAGWVRHGWLDRVEIRPS